MKTLNTYIEERLVLSKNKTREYTERPANNDDLRKLIRDTMKLKVMNVI